MTKDKLLAGLVMGLIVLGSLGIAFFMGGCGDDNDYANSIFVTVVSPTPTPNPSHIKCERIGKHKTLRCTKE